MRQVPLFLLILLAAAAQARAGQPPNIILFFTDDQGTRDLACYGATDLHTPNIDGLAQQGLRFTQFYAGSPVCSPSRAALLTGRHPHRAGVPGNCSSSPNEPCMPPEEITLAEALKRTGYRTACIGKWHLGTAATHQPNAQGFDLHFGHLGGCIDNYSHFFYWDGPNRHDLYRNGVEVWEDGAHFGDLLVREAIQFIEQDPAAPFFLYMPLNMPHYPVQPKREFVDRHASLPEPRRSYAAFISQIDQHVGEVLDALDRTGRRDNTYIIFLSDHGHSTEERNFFGAGFAEPFRGAKFSLFEGGIRVPCIMTGPGIPAGETREQVACALDLYPTILEWCAAPAPDQPLDGHPLNGLLQHAEAPTPHPWLHWQTGNQWAVRKGPWKLIHNPVGAALDEFCDAKVRRFLANIEEDPAEQTNLADEHPGIVTELQQLHDQWRDALPESRRP